MTDNAAPTKTTSGEKGCRRHGLLASFVPFRWLAIAVGADILYRVLNDQITVTLSPEYFPEYFSVFKRRQFGLLLEAVGWYEAPVRSAFAVGAWHDGAYLGGPVGTILACRRVRRWRCEEGCGSLVR
jgi:hypothetical protein